MSPRVQIDPPSVKEWDDKTLAREERIRELHEKDISVEKLSLQIVGRSKRPDVDVASMIVGGSIERTIIGASTITIQIHDQKMELLRSGVFDQAVDIQLDGLWYRLFSVEKSDDTLTVVFEDRIAAYLRSKKEVHRANRRRVTRAEFMLSLVRRVKRERIRVVVPELHKKQPIAKLENEDTRKLRRDPGIRADEGVTVKGAQADRTQIDRMERVISVGIRMGVREKLLICAIMTIIQESVVGKAQKSVSGRHIGLFHQEKTPGSVWRKLGGGSGNVEKDARAFYTVARQVDKKDPDATYAQLCEKVQRSGRPEGYAPWQSEARKAVTAFGKDARIADRTFKKPYIFSTKDSSGRPQNYWEALGRLCEEVGWNRFVSGGILYLVAEEDLFRSKARQRVHEGMDGVRRINFRYNRNRSVAAATISCRADRWIAPPGSLIIIERAGPANGKWLVESVTRDLFNPETTVNVRLPNPELPEPAPQVVTAATPNSRGVSGSITTTGGAKGIVDQAAEIAEQFGTYVGSSLRRGDTVGSGQPSDHSQNNASQAARDIGVKGIDLLVGPPSPKIDRAVVAIGNAFGRNYGDGKRTIIDTFNWRGFRIQIIWRTPKYGGHMGHIHIGAKKL